MPQGGGITNQHPAYYRPDALHVTKTTTVSKHWRENFYPQHWPNSTIFCKFFHNPNPYLQSLSPIPSQNCVRSSSIVTVKLHQQATNTNAVSAVLNHQCYQLTWKKMHRPVNFRDSCTWSITNPLNSHDFKSQSTGFSHGTDINLQETYGTCGLLPTPTLCTSNALTQIDW